MLADLHHSTTALKRNRSGTSLLLLEFLQKYVCFFWICLRAFAGQRKQSIKVYPASARLHLPVLVQLSEVLLAVLPTFGTHLSSSPGFILGIHCFYTTGISLYFSFIWKPGSQAWSIVLSGSFVLLSSCEFHSLLLISLCKPTVFSFDTASFSCLCL